MRLQQAHVSPVHLYPCKFHNWVLVSLNTIQCAQSHASSFLTFAEVLVLLMTQIVIVLCD